MAPYKHSIEYIDYCTSCNIKSVIMCCDKCGDSVCGKTRCCTQYPQYKKDNLVLCSSCVHEIENKFKPIIEKTPNNTINITHSR